MVTCHVPEAILICSKPRYHVQHSSCNQGYYLLKSAIVYSHPFGSIQFLQGPNGELNRNIMGPTILVTFRSLKVALLFSMCSKCMSAFDVHPWPERRGSSRSFQLIFPTMIALISKIY